MREQGFQVGGEDVKVAKGLLLHRKLTLCVVKHGESLFESRLQGVVSFLEAVEKVGNELEGASVADKVVGRAVALLCVHSKIRCVFAGTLSKEAKAVLESHSVSFESCKVVDNILNVSRNSICPFELLVKDVSDSDEAYQRLVNACGSKKLLELKEARK